MAVIATSLAGCGGGGAGADASGTAYDFVTPQVNSQRVYSQTILDNSNNTIEETVSETITAVNADGSYVVAQQDPDNDSVTVDGTTYLILTETINFNPSGQESSYSYTEGAAGAVACRFDPHGAGPNYPLMVGASWTLDYTFACGSQTPTNYTQMGTVISVESVSVPAGTYSAIKLQSTVSWTDSVGTIRTQTVTNWRDLKTMMSVKEVIAIAYAGTIPTNGYPVNSVRVLASES
jgi:hypothetical protein